MRPWIGHRHLGWAHLNRDARGCEAYRSGCGGQTGDLVPCRESVSHLASLFRHDEQVSPQPKVHCDAAERREEPLCLPGRGEPLHRPLASSRGLMGLLRPIAEAPRSQVLDRRHPLPVRDLAASQLVGDQHPRHIPEHLEQLAEELRGCLGISSRLDQDVEDVAVLFDRAPQVNVVRR